MPSAIAQVNIGGTMGVSFSFGTTANRLGVVGKGFVNHKAIQLNTTIRWYYNWKSYGPPLERTETQWSAGGIIGFGALDTLREQPFLGTLYQQQPYRNHIGYTYNFYKDDIKTDQLTGTLTIRLNRLQFSIENDAFSFVPQDRYRTAAGHLLYRLNDWTMVGFNMILWTGNPFYTTLRQIKGTRYKGRFGYKDMSGARFRAFSHGILALKIQRALPWGQAAQFQIGADWEYFRHFLQNWLIHDMYFFPKSWVGNGQPHVPMVDIEGNPYLYLPFQRLKPASFFLDVALNPAVFY